MSEQVEAESWMVIEIMGHLRRAGRVSEVDRFGAKLLRVDIPVGPGMRTRQCQIIGVATCLDVHPIRLDFAHDAVDDGMGAPWSGVDSLDFFARSDGFDDWAALKGWWAANHPEMTAAWEGVRIFWGETLKAPA